MQPPNPRQVLARALSIELSYTVHGHFLSNWAHHFLVPELETEALLFYGSGPDTNLERKYPGFDYASPVHRSWLQHYRFHSVFFVALEKCRLIDREIQAICDWRCTLARRHEFEQRSGVTIRNTLWDEVPEHRRPPGSPYAVDLTTEPAPDAPRAAYAASGELPAERPAGSGARIRWQNNVNENPPRPEHSPGGVSPNFSAPSRSYLAQVSFGSFPPHSMDWGRPREDWGRPREGRRPSRTLSHAHPSSARLRQEASEGASEYDAPDSPVTVVHGWPPRTPSPRPLDLRGGHDGPPSVTPLPASADLDMESDDDEVTGVELVARSVGTLLQRRLLAAAEAGSGCEAVGAISPLWEQWLREASDPGQGHQPAEFAPGRMGTLDHIADLQRRMSGVALDLAMPLPASARAPPRS